MIAQRSYRQLKTSYSVLTAITFASILLAGASAAQAAMLYGITLVSNGKTSLVQVNTNTGAATFVKSFDVPTGFVPEQLAYDSAAGVFLSRGDQNPGDPPRLGIIDPLGSAVQVVPISGLPVNQQKVNGIEYWAAQSSIVVTFGPPPNTEDHLAQINLTGAVLRTSANLGLGDRDNLAQNPITGDLLAIDFNDLAPRLAIVRDPFGTLSTSAYANPPVDGSLSDAAISPDTGQVFASRAIGDNELVRVNVATNDYSTIGMFGTSSPVVGLAFVPEPPAITLLLVGLAFVAVLNRRRRAAEKHDE